jgi:hypothetical protein
MLEVMRFAIGVPYVIIRAVFLWPTWQISKQNIMEGLDGGSESDCELTINKDYAANYEKWRSKEEYQKRKTVS